MSQKDYVALAAEIARWAGEGNSQDAELMRRCLARGIARVCAGDNHRFNMPKFMAACKVPTGEEGG